MSNSSSFISSLKLIENAEGNGNRPAGRRFIVIEKSV
jgi:hypothetical protein